MKTSPPALTERHKSKCAFTLIELLLVMGIILMLMTLSLGSISAWKSQKLNAQARQLASEFKYAAMLAQTENYPIEFRIYLVEDELKTEKWTPELGPECRRF